MRKILKRFSAWLERRENLRRFHKDTKDYEADVGSNMRDVEKAVEISLKKINSGGATRF